MEKQRTRLFFIPNAARTTSLPQIHAALERQMEKLKVAAASAQSAVCA
jgi:hypothetical protein